MILNDKKIKRFLYESINDILLSEAQELKKALKTESALNQIIKDTVSKIINGEDSSITKTDKENLMNKHSRQDIADKTIVELLNHGFIIHGTTKSFKNFETQYIRGGDRGRQGYGFYFSDMSYKPLEYGTVIYVVKKTDFRFLDLTDKINLEMFKPIDYDLQKAIIRRKLDIVKNIREYDYYTEEYEKIKDKLSDFGFNPYSLIEKAVNTYHSENYGELFWNVEHPDKMWPLISEMMVNWGYDGGYHDHIYTIFNFDKLNKKMIRVDLTDNIHINL